MKLRQNNGRQDHSNSTIKMALHDSVESSFCGSIGFICVFRKFLNLDIGYSIKSRRSRLSS